VPKAWLFSPGFLAAVDKARMSGQMPFAKQLQIDWGTPEESRALHFYYTKAVPWLICYGPSDNILLWKGALPRTASSVPALKHLLVAVALIECPLIEATPDTILARSQSIIRHYTLGIQSLQSNDITPVESALAPMLAWLIETFSFNETHAKLHIKGCQVLHQHTVRSIQNQNTLSPDDFIHDSKHTDMMAHMHGWACLRAKVAPHTSTTTASIPSNVYGSLAMFNTNITPVLSADVRAAFARYWKHVHPPPPAVLSPDDITAAQIFISDYEAQILRYRYRSAEPTAVFNILHLMCCLAHLLLPVPFFVDASSEGNHPAVGYHAAGYRATTVSSSSGTASNVSSIGTKPFSDGGTVHDIHSYGNIQDQDQDQDAVEKSVMNSAFDYVVERTRWMMTLQLERKHHTMSIRATAKLILQTLLERAQEGTLERGEVGRLAREALAELS
jgi:hypothetical protein